MAEADYEEIRQNAEKSAKTPVYIALFGQPGAGKSSLINAITGKPDLVKVGVGNDETFEREDHEWNGLFLSDLPGYGTARFPADKYREKFKIDQFDIFLCVTSGKLKEDDILFFRQLRQDGKHCIFVRNKIDAEYQPGQTDADLRARIKENLAQQIGESVEVVFTSCRTGEGLDELQNAIEGSLVGVKRDRFNRSAAAYSKEFLEKKKKACREYALYAAGVSAAANMVPVPGLGIAVDVGAILGAMGLIRNDFNLTEARLDKFAHIAPNFAPIANQIISFATKEGVLQLLKRFAAGQVVAEVSKFFPGIGSLVAGAVSFGVNILILNFYIDDCYEIASEMLAKHFRD
ncbi:GTPase [Acidocella facilis]|uniref:GTPase n=1 Tax=Acidocella facilis TaxID=525 RepID=UPI00047A9EEA|nr:GTPase [Acidocella facilis]